MSDRFRRLLACPLIAALSLALWVGLVSLSFAQSGAPSQCGPISVGNSAVAVTFPASGTTGPSTPKQYLTIVNPSTVGTCWINALSGGTAAANAAGSMPLNTNGGYWTWSTPDYPPPAAVSIICPSGATAITCNYR